MDSNRLRMRTTVVLVAAAVRAVSAGGWSVITVSHFPDYAVVGKPLTLTFAVRQHGTTLVSGLTPSVKASAPGGPAVIVRGVPTSRPGEYSATLALDRVGDWSIVVDSGFNPEDRTRHYNSITLPALQALRTASAPLVLFTEAERGAGLMVTKGCVSCHAPGSARDVIKRRLTADHVTALLTDAGMRPFEMPDLGLKPAEVSALVAYVTGSRVSNHQP